MHNDTRPCTGCADGVVEYEHSARAFICSGCGLVAVAATATNLQPVYNPSGASTWAPPDSGAGARAFSRAALVAAAANRVARALGMDSPALSARVRAVGRQVAVMYRPVPRARELRVAGVAAVLLAARLDRRALALADVSRVSGETMAVLAGAYARLVRTLSLVAPVDDPAVYLVRFVRGIEPVLQSACACADHWYDVVYETSRCVTLQCESMWLASGRRPMAVAAAAVALSARSFCVNSGPGGAPAPRAFLKALSTVSALPLKSLRAQHAAVTAGLARQMDKFLPWLAPVPKEQAHEHLRLYLEVVSEQTAATAASDDDSHIPASLAASRSLRKQRLERVSRARVRMDAMLTGGAPEAQAASGGSISDEDLEVEYLLRAGASEQEILTGHYESIAARIVDDAVGANTEGENDDLSSDSMELTPDEVQTFLRTPAEILAYSMLRTSSHSVTVK